MTTIRLPRQIYIIKYLQIHPDLSRTHRLKAKYCFMRCGFQYRLRYFSVLPYLRSILWQAGSRKIHFKSVFLLLTPLKRKGCPVDPALL